MNELRKSHGNANLLASMSAMVLPIVTSLAGFLEAVLRELLEKILASVEYKASPKPEKPQQLCNMDLISGHLGCVI